MSKVRLNRRFALALTGALAIGAITVAVATPASADYDSVGYINALDSAGLIDHDG
jgi:hypothetical protein